MLGLLGSNFGNQGTKATGPPEGCSAILSSTHSHYSQEIFLPCKRLSSSWNWRNQVWIYPHFGSGVSRPLWTSPYHQLSPPLHRNLHMWVEIMVLLSISYVGFNFLMRNIKQLGPTNPKIPLQLQHSKRVLLCLQGGPVVLGNETRTDTHSMSPYLISAICTLPSEGSRSEFRGRGILPNWEIRKSAGRNRTNIICIQTDM